MREAASQSISIGSKQSFSSNKKSIGPGPGIMFNLDAQITAKEGEDDEAMPMENQDHDDDGNEVMNDARLDGPEESKEVNDTTTSTPKIFGQFGANNFVNESEDVNSEVSAKTKRFRERKFLLSEQRRIGREKR